MSQGTTCYFGSVPGLRSFFSQCEAPVPEYTNLAEHALDAVNTDFDRQTSTSGPLIADRIRQTWAKSSLLSGIERDLEAISKDGSVIVVNKRFSHWRGLPNSVLVLIHRGLVKSVRDVVAYWIRLLMYTGKHHRNVFPPLWYTDNRCRARLHDGDGMAASGLDSGVYTAAYECNSTYNTTP